VRWSRRWWLRSAWPLTSTCTCRVLVESSHLIDFCTLHFCARDTETSITCAEGARRTQRQTPPRHHRPHHKTAEKTTRCPAGTILPEPTQTEYQMLAPRSKLLRTCSYTRGQGMAEHAGLVCRCPASQPPCVPYSGKAQHPHDSHAQLYSQAHHYWSTEIGEHEMNPRAAAPPQ